MSDMHTVYAGIGFLLAAYSVIGNDSVQTLGTFIASNREKVKWYTLWAASAAVLTFAIVLSWYINDGDIAWGRLDKIPWQEVQWYHVLAPAILVGLTGIGIPVSTTFLVISAFASTVVLEKMLVKSVVGYGLAAIVAYALWFVVARFINEKVDPVKPEHVKHWVVFQWLATGFLWFSWLAHDMANVAVYLPRELPLWLLLACLVVLNGFLALIFWQQGGKIQDIVLTKTGTRFVRSASIIDLVYAVVLWFFKEYNSIPMSTTWVFVGLLTGRELAISTVRRAEYKLGYVFPIVGKDFMKMMIGLAVSVALVLMIHNVFTDGSLANGP